MSESVFISHDSRDHEAAVILQSLVQATFKGVEAFVSGADLRGGDVWIERLRGKLEESCAIVALVTPNGLSSAWVHFEAGAGFCEQKTIPFVAGGLSLSDLFPPFSLLQARPATVKGLGDLLSDIGAKCGQRDVFDADDRKRMARAAEELNLLPAAAPTAGSPTDGSPTAAEASSAKSGARSPLELPDAEFLELYERRAAESANFERALNFAQSGLEMRKRYERLKGLPLVDLGTVLHRGVAWHAYKHGEVLEVLGPFCPDDGALLRTRNLLGLDYPVEEGENISPLFYTTLYCRDCREQYDLETRGSRTIEHEVQRVGDCRADVLRKLVGQLPTG